MSEERNGGRGVMCYACGVENQNGLHMEFRRDGDRTVCDYTPCDYQQGYPNRMHGGLVATMIDEAMGWAVYGAREWGATARLNVRFRRPVRLDQTLRIEAWVTNDRSRLIELRGEVRDASGALLAEGDGTFMKLDERTAAQMTDLARDAGRTDAPIV
ncbi:MAG TPA: PaaI family thioesterase [Gemmatimonadaceae bacterium]